VHVVDERIKTSYSLGEKPPASIRQLVGEDSLLPIEPLSSSLQAAEKIILAPRLRYSDEGRAEWLQRLKEVGQNMTEGCTLVNLVPLTLGGNRETLTILEEQSGIKAGDGFSYVYAPYGGSKVAGYTGSGAPPDWASGILGNPNWSSSVDEAELLYVRWSLATYTPKALDASFYRDPMMNFQPQSTLFLDDLSQGFYEMQLLTDTLQHGDTLHHLATGALKSVSSYAHTLESYLRLHSREKGLKAIRSRILLVWRHDSSEMKGERVRLLEMFLNSLREVFGDVDHWNPSSGDEARARPPNIERYQMIVACSQEDLEMCRTALRRSAGQALIAASIPIRLV
jgi:hypothetical protein